MATERFDIVITAQGTTRTAREINRIGQEASATRKSLALMRNALVVFSAARAFSGIIDTADALTNLRNRLQATLGSFSAAREAQAALINIANNTRTSLETTADAFARLALGAQDLGLGTERLLNITELLNKAIVLSGATAQESRNAMIQLAQGIASGTLRGDELRAVLEQLPLVARLIAKELGVTIGKLRDLGKEGKITSEIVLSAIENAGEGINRDFANTVETIGQALAKLNTAFTVFLDKLNSSSQFSNIVIGAIGLLSDAMDVLSENTTAVNLAFGALATGGLLILGRALKLGGLLTAITGGIGTLVTAFRVLAPIVGVASAALIVLKGVLAALYAPATLLVAAIVGIGAGLNAIRASTSSAQAGFDSLTKTVSDLKKNLDEGAFGSTKQVDEGIQQAEQAIVSYRKQLEFLSSFKGKIATLLGMAPADVAQVKAGLDSATDSLRRLNEARGNLAEQEMADAFDADDFVEFSKDVEKTIAKLKEDISELQVFGVDRAIKEAFNSAKITDELGAEAAAVERLVRQKFALKEADDAREEAARKAKQAAERQIRDAKKLIEENETTIQQIQRFTKESEALIPIIVKQGKTQQEAEALVARAIQEKTDKLNAELRSKTDPVLAQFLTAREVEKRVTEDLARALPALVELLGDEEKAKAALARATAKAVEEKQKEAAADANAIKARFDLNAQLVQEQERISKAFEKANRQGGSQVLPGPNEAEAIRLVKREILGLGNEAFLAGQKLEALKRFAEEFPGDAEEVARAVRNVNIALLETQTSASAGAERFLLKYLRDVDDVAKQTEDLLGTAFKGLEDVLVEFGKTGKLTFSDLISSIEAELLRFAAKGLIASVLGGITGQKTNGGLFGDLFGGGGSGGASGFASLASSIGSLLGFANGGSFTVGAGSSIANIPGQDNRLVAFRAKDGERVSVTPKGQSPSSRPVQVTMNIQTPDANSFRKSQGQILTDAERALRRAGARNG